MSRKKFKRFKGRVICLTIITCLCTMGIGFAGWKEGVILENNISTGNLDIHLSSDIDCRWYMITIGGVTGVAKVQIEMQPENNLINIDITKFLVSFIPKDLKCGLWIEIPFSVRNDGTMTVENTILYDNNSDKYIDILDDKEIAVREEGQSLLRINLLEVDDGRVENRYKIAGADNSIWGESISIMLRKRSIFNPFRKRCEDDSISTMSFSGESSFANRTSGSSITYRGIIEEVVYDGEASIEEIDKDLAQEIIESIMNPPAVEVEMKGTTGAAIEMNIDKTTGSSIGVNIDGISKIFKKYEGKNN